MITCHFKGLGANFQIPFLVIPTKHSPQQTTINRTTEAMSKKDKKGRSGVVYSTNPDFEYTYQEGDDPEELPANQQKLRVLIDRKQRKGKEVTLVTGFVGPESPLQELGKYLKTKCGVGGSVKDGEIILQGDHRERVVALLMEKGYSNTKKAGG